jgi:hypothetical protein
MLEFSHPGAAFKHSAAPVEFPPNSCDHSVEECGDKSQWRVVS